MRRTASALPSRGFTYTPDIPGVVDICKHTEGGGGSAFRQKLHFGQTNLPTEVGTPLWPEPKLQMNSTHVVECQACSF